MSRIDESVFAVLVSVGVLVPGMAGAADPMLWDREHPFVWQAQPF